MPRLIGTNRDDFLIGRSGLDWVIRGRGGDDEIYDGGGGDGTGSGTGNDRLYGDLGDDKLYAISGGFDQALGGKGNDEILVLNGVGRGGVGDDSVTAYGLAVGGPGDDVVGGTGQLFGDEGPGLASRVVGDDQLYVPMGNTFSTMTGGLGNDLFQVTCGSLDGLRGTAVITDFTPGADVIWAGVTRPGDTSGDGRSAREFALLDANHNGVLEWSDSVGPDERWDTNDGGAVYTDGRNMYIGLGATSSGTTGSDAEDWLVVYGVTQITAADWVMT